MSSVQSFYVTFPEKGHGPVLVRTDGTQDNQLTYLVNVPLTQGEDPNVTSARAVNAARPRYEAYLAAKAALLVASLHRSKPGNQWDKPPRDPQLVFNPDEIKPLIEQALVRMVVVAERAIRLTLSPHGTASTDCVSSVTLNPDPFLRGKIEAGNGRCLHEVGHIRYDVHGSKKDKPRRPGELPWGIQLLERARAEGGEPLQHILNLIMDRRADDLQCLDYTGNVSAIRHRLHDLMPGSKNGGHGSSEASTTSVFIDFAFACKKRTRARHKVVHRCVDLVKKTIKRVNAGTRKYAELLVVSKKVLKLLNEHATNLEKEDQRFETFMEALMKRIYGPKAGAAMQALFRKTMAARLTASRRQSYGKLPSTIRNISARTQLGGPAPFNHGVGDRDGKIIDVPQNPAAYALVSPAVRSKSGRLSEILRKLSVPQSFVLQGLDQGELDLDALPVLTTGRSDCMKVDLQTFKLDLAFALLLDVSGSMSGHGANSLAVTFNDALFTHKRVVDSQLFAFNDNVFRCGSASPNNGIAGIACERGTLEGFGVRVAGNWLRTSRRSRKVLLTICDGGPSDPVQVRKEIDELTRRGIIPIRVLVGVDAAPKTYPIELMFDNWDEFYRELEQLFGAIISATRV